MTDKEKRTRRTPSHLQVVKVADVLRSVCRSNDDEDNPVATYAMGWSDARVAEQENVSAATVASLRRELMGELVRPDDPATFGDRIAALERSVMSADGLRGVADVAVKVERLAEDVATLRQAHDAWTGAIKDHVEKIRAFGILLGRALQASEVVTGDSEDDLRVVLDSAPGPLA